ncbi:ABC transporter substrate-binding protein [Nocardioides sp. GXZ039]|uniref:ABC transporter substrate-binding protein n=1 Tax=Nocardioides sp. GXZ039 TaxID=3136018 RepID=UPI0030F43698
MNLRRPLAAVFTATLLLATGACAGDDLANDDESDSPSDGASSDTGSESSAPPASDGEAVTIASQSFPEAAMVASMYEQLLEAGGYTAEVQLVDARDAYMSTFPGDVDVVPEYVGGIVNFLNTRENGDSAKPFESGDGQQLADDGAQLLDEAGITLLDISEATDTNAFFVTKKYSEDNDVTKLSDLKGKSIKLAAAPDCEGRLDCEGGLSDQYGIDITEVLPLGYASDQTYKAVIDGEVELGETSTTDGTLESQDLVVLEDDMQIQPAQNLVPAVSTEFLTAHPDLADLLNPLMGKLTTENLTELNARVSVNREKAEDVAKSFLTEEGLL